MYKDDAYEKLERLGELREKDRDGLLCEDEWEEYDILKDELRNWEG